MYLPKKFRCDEAAVLREVMQQYGFATLITVHDGAPFASHLPFLFEEKGGGVLLGHMARANRQWRDFSGGGEVLVVFQGPDAYVSPGWYRDALHVPTWNYVAVHAYGTPRILSKEELREALGKLSAKHEAGRGSAWSFEGLPADFVEELLREIVGFSIAITRLEGKLKLSQNREPEDQARVQERLLGGADPRGREVGEWMDRLYSGKLEGG